MDIVEYIRLCLVKRGNISASELARRAEITPQNLSNKFSRNKFSNEDLEKIAAALGIWTNEFSEIIAANWQKFKEK